MTNKKGEAIDLIHLYEKFGLNAPLVKFEDSEIQLKINRFLPSVGVTSKKREMVNAIFDICEKSSESITSLRKVSEVFWLICKHHTKLSKRDGAVWCCRNKGMHN